MGEFFYGLQNMFRTPGFWSGCDCYYPRPMPFVYNSPAYGNSLFGAMNYYGGLSNMDYRYNRAANYYTEASKD